MEKKIKRIIWTAPSKQDLQTIYDYYSQHSVRIADKIVQGILDRTEILYRHPEAGQKEELLKHKPDIYRYLVQGNYKIIYRVRVETVIIDWIFDCRQNPLKMGNV